MNSHGDPTSGAQLSNSIAADDYDDDDIVDDKRPESEGGRGGAGGTIAVGASRCRERCSLDSSRIPIVAAVSMPLSRACGAYAHTHRAGASIFMLSLVVRQHRTIDLNVDKHTIFANDKYENRSIFGALHVAHNHNVFYSLLRTCTAGMANDTCTRVERRESRRWDFGEAFCSKAQ